MHYVSDWNWDCQHTCINTGFHSHLWNFHFTYPRWINNFEIAKITLYMKISIFSIKDFGSGDHLDNEDHSKWQDGWGIVAFYQMTKMIIIFIVKYYQMPKMIIIFVVTLLWRFIRSDGDDHNLYREILSDAKDDYNLCCDIFVTFYQIRRIWS